MLPSLALHPHLLKDLEGKEKVEKYILHQACSIKKETKAQAKQKQKQKIKKKKKNDVVSHFNSCT